MSVDVRTRVDSDQRAVDASAFFRDELPGLLDARHALIAPAAATVSLRDICIETDAEPWTLTYREEGVSVAPGHRGQAHVRLTGEQLTDIVNDQSTPIALMSNGLLDMPAGGLPDFLNWWLVLRAALDERRIHTAGDVRFAGPTQRSFVPEDSDEEMRAFLEDAGYLHIQGMFSEEEMAAVEADYPAAEKHYEKGDKRAWFATTQDGVERLVRMEGFDRYSDVRADRPGALPTDRSHSRGRSRVEA